MHSLLQSIDHGLMWLRAKPRLTTVAVLALALAVGSKAVGSLAARQIPALRAAKVELMLALR